MDYLGNLATRALAHTPPAVRPNLAPYVPMGAPELEQEMSPGAAPARRREEGIAPNSLPREVEAERAALVDESATVRAQEQGDAVPPEVAEREADLPEEAPLVTVERTEQPVEDHRAEPQQQPGARQQTSELRRTITTQLQRARRELAQPVAAVRRQESPIVHVHIGRIEVRAANPQSPPQKTPAKPQVQPMNLDRYLRERRSGRS